MMFRIFSSPYSPTLEFISRKQRILMIGIFFPGMEGVARERCAHSILQS